MSDLIATEQPLVNPRETNKNPAYDLYVKEKGLLGLLKTKITSTAQPEFGITRRDIDHSQEIEVKMRDNPKRRIVFHHYPLTAMTEDSKYNLGPVSLREITKRTGVETLQYLSIQTLSNDNKTIMSENYYVDRQGNSKLLLQELPRPEENKDGSLKSNVSYNPRDMNTEDFKKAEEAVDLLIKWVRRESNPQPTA